MSIRSLCCLCAFQSIAAFLSGCQSSARGGDAALVPAELHGAGAHRFSMASVRGPLSVVDPAPSAAMLESAAPHPRWMRFAAEGLPAYAWVSQFNLSSVSEYHKNNRRNAPPVCNIAGQPYVNGLGVDKAGNVWIPQGGVQTGTTTEFAPNCGKALFAIPDTDGQPAAVAFDTQGNVYVENIMGAGSNAVGNIDVYAPGAKTPKTVLTDSSSFLWFDEAIDARDNVFAIYSDPYNKGHVIEFPHGQNPVKPLPISLGFPGGVTFDSKGNLLVVDQDARNVSVYEAPYSGPPFATFPLQADSVPCKFAHNLRQLYCADFTNASIDVYAYDPANPAATAYAYSFTNGIRRGSQNAGIALAPAPRN